MKAIGDKAFRGMFAKSMADELAKIEGKRPDELLLALLPLARTAARPPLSNFFVGAIVQGVSGNLYMGANIEVPGHALGYTVHAEQASTANAYMSGETGIASIAVTAAPCGHCRQFLNEMSLDGSIRVLLLGASPTKLSALLPMAFGPRDLGFKQGALPVREAKLSLAAKSSDALVNMAVEAARKAYSPYTNSLSGVAIMTSDARTFAGSYIENAAFNPSLPPLQAALAGLFAAGRAADSIVRLTLVEEDSAKISQESAVRGTLKALAPSARIEILKVKRNG